MQYLVRIVLLLLLISSGYAENKPVSQPARDTYYSSGYLIGLNLGQATTGIADKAAYSKENTGFSGRAYIGYNINQYFALQFGYLYLPTSKYTHSSKETIKILNSGFDGLLTGKYPIGEGFSLFGNIGGASLKTKQTESGSESESQNATVLAYGGGIDYVFANIGGLHANLDYYHSDKKNTQTLDVPSENIASVGFYYQF